MHLLAPRVLRSFVLCFVALSAACRTAQSNGSGSTLASAKADQDAPIRITIVGTNDIHGHVFPSTGKLRDGSLVEEGGAATFAGYLANIRADNPSGVILVDGGDLF